MRRPVWILTFWLAMGATATALECQPLKLASTAQPPARYGQGLMFKVFKAGTKPSYVFGTIHISDPRVLKLPDPVRHAFEQSQQLVLEVLFDEQAIAAFTQLFVNERYDLAKHIGSDLFARTTGLLAKHGYPMEMSKHMPPWAAYLTLNMPPPTPDGVPLDLNLMMEGQRRAMRMHGLESVQEQSSTLTELPENDQIALLKDTVCHYDTLQRELVDLTELYIARNLGGLLASTRKYELYRSKPYERLLASLLWSRNTRMVERLEPILNTGDAFVAVGALHLAGEQGILGLLEKAGYEVGMVY